MQKYRQIVFNYYEELEVLNLHEEALNISPIELLSKMNVLDENISKNNCGPKHKDKDNENLANCATKSFKIPRIIYLFDYSSASSATPSGSKKGVAVKRSP